MWSWLRRSNTPRQPPERTEAQRSNKELDVVHWFAEQTLIGKSCSTCLVIVLPGDFGTRRVHGPTPPWCFAQLLLLQEFSDARRGSGFL